MLKNITLSFAAIAALSTTNFAATIASWNFESPNPPDATDFAVYPNPVAPAVGTGNAGGTHASAASDWTTPVGNGTTDSFSVNTWGVNDYFQFTLSTAGSAPIFVSFSATSSGTGPRDFALQYSSNGVTGPFATFTSYAVPANATPNAWSATTFVTAAYFSFDLTGLTALANNPTVAFRLVNTSTVSATGATVATAGTSRVDGFTVSEEAIAPPVPEPAVGLSVIFGSAFILARRRRAF